VSSIKRPLAIDANCRRVETRAEHGRANANVPFAVSVMKIESRRFTRYVGSILIPGLPVIASIFFPRRSLARSLSRARSFVRSFARSLARSSYRAGEGRENWNSRSFAKWVRLGRVRVGNYKPWASRVGTTLKLLTSFRLTRHLWRHEISRSSSLLAPFPSRAPPLL